MSCRIVWNGGPSCWEAQIRNDFAARTRAVACVRRYLFAPRPNAARQSSLLCVEGIIAACHVGVVRGPGNTSWRLNVQLNEVYKLNYHRLGPSMEARLEWVLQRGNPKPRHLALLRTTTGNKHHQHPSTVLCTFMKVALSAPTHLHVAGRRQMPCRHCELVLDLNPGP